MLQVYKNPRHREANPRYYHQKVNQRTCNKVYMYIRSTNLKFNIYSAPMGQQSIEAGLLSTKSYISEGSVSHINGVRSSFLEITAVSRKVMCS